MEPFPPLPVELVRWIMEIAAKGDPGTSYALICVSTLVHKWIIPILYHSVVMENPDQLQPFKDALYAHGAHVRRLCLTYSNTGIPSDIVRGCPGLEVLYADVNVVSRTMEATVYPGPWMMVVSADVPPLGHPLLRNITHFYIDFLNESFIPTISALSRLTHFGVGCWGDEEEPVYISCVQSLLSLPSLRILLLCAFEPWGEPTFTLLGERWHQLAEITDVRLLVMGGLYKDERIEIVDSGDTLWEDAEFQGKNWRERVVLLEPR